jgi:hydroxyethylthiazole kinase-like sugar kinase family protein
MTKEIRQAAEDITLRATLLRIKRKADIMQMDAPRGTLIEQNATELRLLAGIALRCIGVDSEARQDSHEEKRRKHMAAMDDKRKIEELEANHAREALAKINGETK